MLELAHELLLELKLLELQGLKGKAAWGGGSSEIAGTEVSHSVSMGQAVSASTVNDG